MKKFFSILLISIMIVSLSACVSPQKENPDDSNPPAVDKPNIDDKDESEIKKELEVNIYYTSEEYVVTGNEDLEKLIPEKRIVDYTDISLEEAVIKELLTEPNDTNLFNSIPESVKLIKVKVENDIVYLDFAKEGMSGSSLEESLTIDQIIQSLADLNTVKKVQFLLDGEIPESLMGHITSNEPFEITK